MDGLHATEVSLSCNPTQRRIRKAPQQARAACGRGELEPQPSTEQHPLPLLVGLTPASQTEARPYHQAQQLHAVTTPAQPSPLCGLGPVPHMHGIQPGSEPQTPLLPQGCFPQPHLGPIMQDNHGLLVATPSSVDRIAPSQHWTGALAAPVTGSASLAAPLQPGHQPRVAGRASATLPVTAPAPKASLPDFVRGANTQLPDEPPTAAATGRLSSGRTGKQSAGLPAGRNAPSPPQRRHCEVGSTVGRFPTTVPRDGAAQLGFNFSATAMNHFLDFMQYDDNKLLEALPKELVRFLHARHGDAIQRVLTGGVQDNPTAPEGADAMAAPRRSAFPGGPALAAPANGDPAGAGGTNAPWPHARQPGEIDSYMEKVSSEIADTIRAPAWRVHAAALAAAAAAEAEAAAPSAQAVAADLYHGNDAIRIPGSPVFAGGGPARAAAEGMVTAPAAPPRRQVPKAGNTGAQARALHRHAAEYESAAAAAAPPALADMGHAAGNRAMLGLHEALAYAPQVLPMPAAEGRPLAGQRFGHAPQPLEPSNIPFNATFLAFSGGTPAHIAAYAPLPAAPRGRHAADTGSGSTSDDDTGLRRQPARRRRTGEASAAARAFDGAGLAGWRAPPAAAAVTAAAAAAAGGALKAKGSGGGIRNLLTSPTQALAGGGQTPGSGPVRVAPLGSRTYVGEPRYDGPPLAPPNRHPRPDESAAAAGAAPAPITSPSGSRAHALAGAGGGGGGGGGPASAAAAGGGTQPAALQGLQPPAPDGGRQTGQQARGRPKQRQRPRNSTTRARSAAGAAPARRREVEDDDDEDYVPPGTKSAEGRQRAHKQSGGRGRGRRSQHWSDAEQDDEDDGVDPDVRDEMLRLLSSIADQHPGQAARRRPAAAAAAAAMRDEQV